MPTINLDTTRNPWRVDATGGALALPLLITTDLVTIDRMEWSSPAAGASDEVEVLDNPIGVAAGSGRRLWDQAVVALDAFAFQRQLTHRPAQGITVNKLTSGTLLIYYT